MLSPALEDREQGKFRDAGSPDGTTSRVAVKIEEITASIPLSSAANTAGAFESQPVDNTGAVTFSPPTNAVGFILQSMSSNTDSVRWAIGATASLTVGNLYEPGRDTGFIPCAAAISVIALAGTQEVSVQWVLSS